MWKQAAVRAPKLFAKYHNKADTFDRTIAGVTEKLYDIAASSDIDTDELAQQILKNLEDSHA